MMGHGLKGMGARIRPLVNEANFKRQTSNAKLQTVPSAIPFLLKFVVGTVCTALSPAHL